MFYIPEIIHTNVHNYISKKMSIIIYFKGKIHFVSLLKYKHNELLYLDHEKCSHSRKSVFSKVWSRTYLY